MKWNGGTLTIKDSQKYNMSNYILVVYYHQRRQWHPTPVLLPGKSHGRRSLVGCSPWGHEESGMTDRLHFHFSLSCIGKGHGNPPQCSCLENPRNRGAWWAAVYGVAQSRTRLKRLSSSILSYTTTLEERLHRAGCFTYRKKSGSSLLICNNLKILFLISRIAGECSDCSHFQVM